MNNYMKTIISGLKQWVSSQKPDWKQNDSSAANYVKNRTHYEEEKLVTLVDNLTSEDYNNGNNIPKCTFVVGNSYNVVLNDTLYENLVCYDDGAWHIIGGTDYLPFYIDDEGGNGFYIEAYEDESFVVSVFEYVKTIHKLDKKYLPDDLVFDNQVYTKDDVYNKDEIYKNGEATFTITWDGNIEEKDKFAFNSASYYKISDVVPDFNAITYGESLFSNGGFRNGFLYEGVNCYRAAYAIIVTQAGLCELAPISEEGYQRLSFTAPSTGIYFYHSDYSTEYQTKMTLLLRNVEKHGIYLNSALTKNFVVGVTDEGALTTEDSNGVIVEMATTDGIVEQISDAVSDKMDKVTDGTSGNFIKLDANGNAVDSGQNTNSFVPMTSLNTFIAPHITNNKIHLPTVTTADNGKILMVVNGQWAAVALPNAEEANF